MGIRRGRLVEQPLTPFLRLSPPAPETTAPQPIVSRSCPGPRVSPTTRARSPNEDIRPPPPPCVSLLLLPSPLRDQGEEARPVQLIRNQPCPPSSPHHLRQDAWNRQHPRRAVDEPLQCDPGPSRPGLCLARGQGRPCDGCRYVLFFFSPSSHFRWCGVSGTAVWEHKRPIAAVWGLAAGGEPVVDIAGPDGSAVLPQLQVRPPPAVPHTPPHTRDPQSRRAPFLGGMEIEWVVGCSQSQALHSQHQMNPPPSITTPTILRMMADSGSSRPWYRSRDGP